MAALVRLYKKLFFYSLRRNSRDEGGVEGGVGEGRNRHGYSDPENCDKSGPVPAGKYGKVAGLF